VTLQRLARQLTFRKISQFSQGELPSAPTIAFVLGVVALLILGAMLWE
jgi:hypothetical protein